MDRLIALVALRFRLELRGFFRVRARMVGVLLMVPVLVLFSAVASVFAFLGVRSLAGSDPALLVPISAAVATAMGAFWMFSPLLAGVALTETHDVTRLLQFPIPVRTLVVSSLIANLVQPLVLAEIPLMAAVAIGLAGEVSFLPFTLFGVALSFAAMIAASQTSGLLLLGVARNRRFQDASLLLGILVGVALSIAPFALLMGGSRGLGALVPGPAASALLPLSPFGWGLRAAVHASQGDLRGFFAFASAGALAVGATLMTSGWLLARIHRGEMTVGPSAAEPGLRARMRLPGALGALVEKDLRVGWRDPALKASVFLSLLGPLFFLFFLFQSGSRRATTGLLMMALFVGSSTAGGNAFGMERRGLSLLFGFPLARWRVLVGKNLAALVYRLPTLLLLALGGLALGAGLIVPVALVLALVVLIVASGCENFASILVPMPVADPGRSAHPAASRGLGGAFLALGLLLASMLAASPFAFLCWLPLLLGEPMLFFATLPLALLGALAVYALLVAGAASLLEKREPELLERVLGEW